MRMNGLEYLYKDLVDSDTVVSRLLKVSELSQIARIEMRLRDFFLAKWRQRSDEAIDLAVDFANQSKTDNEIIDGIEKVISSWKFDVMLVFSEEIKRAFDLARIAMYKKVVGEIKEPLAYNPSDYKSLIKAEEEFDRTDESEHTDEQIVGILLIHQLFWLGKHYDNNVSPAVAKAVRKAVKELSEDSAGLSRVLRKELKDVFENFKVPGGFSGSSELYFESIVANAVTTAKTYGQLRSLSQYGVTHYRINAINDRRTCGRCLHMDGKVFTVRQGMSQMASELRAKTPEALKSISPWLGLKDLKAISPISGNVSLADSKSLADAGFVLPPFHLKCRCGVDTTTDYEIVTDPSVWLPPIPILVTTPGEED